MLGLLFDERIDTRSFTYTKSIVGSMEHLMCRCHLADAIQPSIGDIKDLYLTTCIATEHSGFLDELLTVLVERLAVTSIFGCEA